MMGSVQSYCLIYILLMGFFCFVSTTSSVQLKDEEEDIDWISIADKIPFVKTDEAKTKRVNLFNRFDTNKNKLLSLSEIQKGVRNVLGLEQVAAAKAALMRAYTLSKGLSKKENYMDFYIEFREFRFFLETLYNSYKYDVTFKRIDADRDGRISLIEFRNATEIMEKQVGKINNPGMTFRLIDINGGGSILYKEFCRFMANMKKMSSKMDAINSREIISKVPRTWTKDSKAERKALFKKFDGDTGNKMLSLGEVERGVKDGLKLDQIYNAKPAIKRAFDLAKVKSNKGNDLDNYIESKSLDSI